MGGWPDQACATSNILRPATIAPAYYKGKFSDDGNTATGAWVYPGGGGYESIMTRVTS